MRILLVTPMWPGPADPDLGAFLVPVVRELRALGHVVDVVAIDRRAGGPRRHLDLARRTVGAARRSRPDVIFAHMIFPAGLGALVAARAIRRPLVVMAHGQDVANLARRSLAQASAPVLRGADAIIANSRWLSDQLPRPADAVIDCGIDLAAFTPRPRGTDPSPHLVCIGSLIPRKRVVELADAFAELGRGRLTFVGDGPLRSQLRGRTGVELAGAVPHAEIPGWIARADVVCQPSEREPFGQVTLEALAMERAVAATSVGGPPEFVAPGTGVLVDPTRADALPAALRQAIALGTPCPPARRAAAAHDVRRQAARMADVLVGVTGAHA